MAKRILFAPVGGTDPISENNVRDGAILQICRKYRPDIVYLYMSAEILEKHRKDNRYLYCLNKLGEMLGTQINSKIIDRPDLVEVQQFDYFYKDFSEIISAIEAGMTKDDELILNVSSGTPAMKSALMVLCSLTGISCKAVQVATPVKAMNEHTHKGEDIQVLWELDLDNDPTEYVDRTEEVRCPWILANQKKKLIRSHVLAYDYEAAMAVDTQMPLYKDGTYVRLLKAAAERKLLNYQNMFSILKSVGEEDNDVFRPVRNDEKRVLFEYALSLELKQKRGEYADFLRALTPIVVDLYIAVLQKCNSFNIADYYSYNSEKLKRWEVGKISGTGLEHVIMGAANKQLKKDFIQSYQLLNLIKKYIPASESNIIQTCIDLRSVEEDIRNRVAHEMVGVSDSLIKSKVGYSSSEIMDMIRKLMFYIDGGFKKYWDSYDEMNEYILERMEKEIG